MLASCGKDSVSDGAESEILVVDNGPNERTAEVVEEFRERLPLRLLREPGPGKSRALNTGLAVAGGELLLFADDDVELRPGWRAAFVEAARRQHRAGWFGGRSIPKWGPGSPAWARRELPSALRGYFCSYDLGESGRFYEPGDLLPIGACMAVRASTFAAIGGYDPGYGPVGGRRGTGDDTELVERALARGIPGCWVPGAIVDHYVPAERARLRAVLGYGAMKGAQQAASTGGRLTRPRALLRIAGQASRGLLQALRAERGKAMVCALNIGLAWGASSGPGRRGRERGR